MKEKVFANFKSKILSEKFVSMNIKFKDTFAFKSANFRPVIIKEKKHLQFNYLDGKQCFTKNYTFEEMEQVFNEVLNNAQAATLKCLDENLIYNQGKIKKELTQNEEPTYDVNMKKNYIFDQSTPFFEVMGISQNGKLLHRMTGKFTQINEFLKLFDQTNFLKDKQELITIDFGCGLSYLTVALHHFIEKKGISCETTGVDSNTDIINKCKDIYKEYKGLTFVNSSILKYEITETPDIVVALHACDTATDQAIFKGIQAKSKVIICAPCCHSTLKLTVKNPLLKHGIIQQRLQDLLTDQFRGLLLRILGYKTDIIEFVSPDHTTKNIMIRSVYDGISPKNSLEEYLELKKIWQVTPALEKYLVDAKLIEFPNEKKENE